jgi:hypothetical protein
MGAKIYLETSATNYQSTLHNTPEERRSHFHRGGTETRYKFYYLPLWTELDARYGCFERNNKPYYKHLGTIKGEKFLA